MRYLNIWPDEQGESHVRELETRFESREGYAKDVPPVGISAASNAGRAYLLQLPARWLGDFHTSPALQYAVQLQGRLLVTMSDGDSITSDAGTLWLLEDTHGKGHRTQVLGDEDAILLIVTIA